MKSGKRKILPGLTVAEKSIRPPDGEDNLIYSVCCTKSNHKPCEYRMAWKRAAALAGQIFVGERDSAVPASYTCRSRTTFAFGVF